MRVLGEFILKKCPSASGTPCRFVGNLADISSFGLFLVQLWICI